MRQGLDIADVEVATKIRAKYLRALENEEFGMLPGPTFVKTFLRTYAEMLGLDPHVLVEEYRANYESEDEIARITDHWREQGEPELHEELLEAVETEGEQDPGDFDPDQDELLGDAIATVVQLGSASTSMLQRRLRVGYTRAGRLIDMMERRGVISGYEGSKARQVLITEADLPRVLAALDEPVGAAAGDTA